MSDAVKTAFIAGFFSVLGIIITAYVTKSSIMHELDKRLAILEVKQNEMAEDVKSHNNYAKMFAENIPVLKEQMREMDERLDRMERKAG